VHCPLAIDSQTKTCQYAEKKRERRANNVKQLMDELAKLREVVKEFHSQNKVSLFLAASSSSHLVLKHVSQTCLCVPTFPPLVTVAKHWHTRMQAGSFWQVDYSQLYLGGIPFFSRRFLLKS
jgi:hypothetical protein